MSEQRRYLHVLALSYAQKAGLPEGERREFLSPADLSGKKIKNLKKMKKVVDKQKERWYYKPRC